MHSLRPRNPSILRTNKYRLATDPIVARGFKKRQSPAPTFAKGKQFQKRNPQIFKFVGNNVRISQIFPSIGERKIARAISIELNKPSTTSRLDICTSVTRMFKGATLDYGTRRYPIAESKVMSVLKRLIREGLVEVRV